MTVSSTDNREQYTGTGSTATFSFPYIFFEDADLVVETTVIATGIKTTQTLDGGGDYDYTISGTYDSAQQAYLSGADVVLNANLPATHRITIRRVLDITQGADYIDGDGFPAETHERALDRLTLICQQLSETIDRAVVLPSDTTLSSITIPSAVANNLWGWNSDATDLENKIPADLDLATVTAFVSTLLDDSDAATARGTLGSGAVGDSLFQAATTAAALALVNIMTTRGQILRQGASAAEALSLATEGKVAKGDGTDVVAGDIVENYGTEDLTNGGADDLTAVGVTGIASYHRAILVSFVGASNAGNINGDDDVILQLGDSGGYENTGYIGETANDPGSSTNSWSDGIRLDHGGNGANRERSGHILLTHMGSNVWSASVSIGDTVNGAAWHGAGTKTLTGALDRIQITTSAGSEAFDNGNMNIIGF